MIGNNRRSAKGGSICQQNHVVNHKRKEKETLER